MGVAVVWPFMQMAPNTKNRQRAGLGAQKRKFDLIIFINISCICFSFSCISCIWFSFSCIFVFVFDGPFMQLALNTKSGRGPWKENMIWLFLTVFYSIDFIFLYFLICSCWAIPADGPHHQEWPESRGPGKGNCSPFAHFSNTDCGFALYFHKVRMVVGIVDYFYRTRVRSLGMLVSNSPHNA